MSNVCRRSLVVEAPVGVVDVELLLVVEFVVVVVEVGAVDVAPVVITVVVLESPHAASVSAAAANRPQSAMRGLSLAASRDLAISWRPP
ncbi:MAG: hypothetical protein ACRDMH_07370 [Solirubrobacterales bacterium]